MKLLLSIVFLVATPFGLLAATVTVPVSSTNAQIQTIFDNNPNAVILFEDGNYTSNGSIVLTDATGRNFQGKIVGVNATITFTNAGSSSDSDVAMQRGFASYPRTNGAGGDVTGLYGVSVEGLTIIGPTNGAGFYAANSFRLTLTGVTSKSNRYGVLLETSIGATVQNGFLIDNKNAGVGLLFLNDTSRVWYSTSPSSSYWNDSTKIDSNTFLGTSGGSRLAGILDHGSNSQSIRNISNNIFVTDPSGAVGSKMVYGYLARKASAIIEGNWWEDVSYNVRFLTTNTGLSSETNISGITDAQPNGTYNRSNFPDGSSYFASITGNMSTRAVNDFNLQGVSAGKSYIGQNLSSGLSGCHIVTTESAGQVFDAGDTILAGTYKCISYVQTYRSLAGMAPSDAPVLSGLVALQGSTSALQFQPRDGTGTVFAWYNPTGDGLELDASSIGTVFSITSNGTFIMSGDIATPVGKGPVVRSPNGTCFRLAADNAGALSTVSITCP